jgi:hypothetical protein
MTRYRRFWYRVNTFVARFTDPVPAPRQLGPWSELSVPPTWLQPPEQPDRPTGPGFHPFRVTLIDTPVSRITEPGFLPDRAWWDQRGENNPWPIDPPAYLDFTDLNAINNNWR